MLGACAAKLADHRSAVLTSPVGKFHQWGTHLHQIAVGPEQMGDATVAG